MGLVRWIRKAFGGGCMNMLPKDHIYVVQGYMTCICPIKFNNTYMMFENIYMVLNRYVVSVIYVEWENILL